MEFMPQNAPLMALGFLFTVLVLGVTGLAFLWTLAAGKRSVALRVFLVGAIVGGLYAGTLLALSVSSEEKTLPVGQLKYFCEIDCHVAYGVAGVQTAKVLGSGPQEATAAGTFYVVTLRTWFDERTISSRRPKDMPLVPNLRVVRVVDEGKREFRTSLEGQKALLGSTVPLAHALRPGESYETVLVFDLPDDAVNPRLLVADWDPVTRLLAGHENSFLHKKIFFRLEPEAAAQR